MNGLDNAIETLRENAKSEYAKNAIKHGVSKIEIWEQQDARVKEATQKYVRLYEKAKNLAINDLYLRSILRLLLNVASSYSQVDVFRTKISEKNEEIEQKIKEIEKLGTTHAQWPQVPTRKHAISRDTQLKLKFDKYRDIVKHLVDYIGEDDEYEEVATYLKGECAKKANDIDYKTCVSQKLSEKNDENLSAKSDTDFGNTLKLEKSKVDGFLDEIWTTYMIMCTKTHDVSECTKAAPATLEAASIEEPPATVQEL